MRSGSRRALLEATRPRVSLSIGRGLPVVAADAGARSGLSPHIAALAVRLTSDSQPRAPAATKHNRIALSNTKSGSLARSADEQRTSPPRRFTYPRNFDMHRGRSGCGIVEHTVRLQTQRGRAPRSSPRGPLVQPAQRESSVVGRSTQHPCCGPLVASTRQRRARSARLANTALGGTGRRLASDKVDRRNSIGPLPRL